MLDCFFDEGEIKEVDNIYKLFIYVGYFNDESLLSINIRDYFFNNNMGYVWLELEKISNNGEVVEYKIYGIWNFDLFGKFEFGGLYENVEKNREFDILCFIYIIKE